MRIPATEAAALRAGRLPLGPLAEPLGYWRAGEGKLHASRECPRLTSSPYWVTNRSPRARVLRRAATITESDLCRNCTEVLPGPAEQHAAIGRALLRVQAETQAVRAAGASWTTVAALHAAADIARRLLGDGVVEQPLATAATRVLATADRAHARAAVRLGRPDELAAAGGPVIVLFLQYNPQERDVTWPGSREVTAAAATAFARDLHRQAGYALLPAPPVSSWLDQVPAEPGDTARVLATALSLAEPQLSDNQLRHSFWYTRKRALTDALTTARLIHADGG